MRLPSHFGDRPQDADQVARSATAHELRNRGLQLSDADATVNTESGLFTSLHESHTREQAVPTTRMQAVTVWGMQRCMQQNYNAYGIRVMKCDRTSWHVPAHGMNAEG